MCFNIIRNFRYRTAFSFGRAEHFFSRLLFVMLLITYGFYLPMHLHGVYYLGQFNHLNYLLLTDIGLWVLYWICHRLEKAFHPNH